MTSSNFTEHQIDNLGERCFLVSYLFLVFLSSFIGDTIILIASTKYDAIKLNKSIVSVMQHIAACNILLSVSILLPTIVSLTANSWILGNYLKYPVNFLKEVCLPVSRILTTLLATVKLFIVKFPLKAPMWTKAVSHGACLFSWLSVIVFHGLLLSRYRCILFFSYIEYFIECQLISDHIIAISFGYALTTFVLPTIIVFIVTAMILSHLLKARKVSRNSGGNVRWHGIVAVFTTTTVFCLASIPYLVVFMYIQVETTESNGVLSTSMAAYTRSCYFITTLNLLCNFYVFYFTIPSFRQFVVSKIQQLASYIKCRTCHKKVNSSTVLKLEPAPLN